MEKKLKPNNKNNKWTNTKLGNQQLVGEKAPLFPGFLSAGMHISRVEVKENRNIWLEFRLVLIMILSKDYLNSYSQKYLPVFFHAKCYKLNGNGYCKKSWKYVDEFSTEHPKSWKCHIPLLASTFHGVLPSWDLLTYSDICSGIFVHGKLLQNVRFSFPWQCNMQIHSTDAKLSPLSAAYHTEIASSVQTPSILLPRL